MTLQQDLQQNRSLEQLEVQLDKAIVQLTDSAGESYWNQDYCIGCFFDSFS